MYHLIACQHRPKKSTGDRPPVILLSDDWFGPCWEKARSIGRYRNFNEQDAVIAQNLPVWTPHKGDPWVYWIVRQD